MMENVRFYLLKSDARHAYTLIACYTRCPFSLSADFYPVSLYLIARNVSKVAVEKNYFRKRERDENK